MLRTLLLALALAAALVSAGLVAGCARRGFEEVRPGMMFTDVQQTAGEPKQVIYGEGVELDKTTWVYPQGRVFFEACIVVRIEKSVAQPTVTERVEQQRGGR